MADVLATEYRLMHVDAVEPHPRNPNVGSAELIAESIDAIGFFGALVVQRSTGHILVGNHRYAAARQQGLDELPVLLVDVDDERALQILLADNRYAQFASWDDDVLTALLKELSGADLLLGTGFDENDLDRLLEGSQIDDDDLGDGVPDFGEADDAEENPELPAPYGDEQIVSEAFAYWRQQKFPMPSITLHESRQQINRLARTDTDRLRNVLTAHTVADAYHPHRFATPIPGKSTPLEAFADDAKLRHAIELLVENRLPITPTGLKNMLLIVHGTQCAANFRPGFALLLLRTYAPQSGVWLDTSTGFGGRIVAFAASQMSRYVGIDPSTLTHAGNERMIADLGIADRAKLIMRPAEDVKLEEIGGPNSCDFAFTSPPYFAKERYADESTQSFARYKSGESWRDGFLLPTLRLQFGALKAGAVSVVNIADVKLGGATYPLVQWTIDCAKAVGFTHERTDSFPLSRGPGQGEAAERFEPVLVFRKA